MIRCDDLVAGMKRVAQRIAKQDTELKKVCLVFYFVFVYPCTKKLKKNSVFVLFFVFG